MHSSIIGNNWIRSISRPICRDTRLRERPQWMTNSIRCIPGSRDGLPNKWSIVILRGWGYHLSHLSFSSCFVFLLPVHGLREYSRKYPEPLLSEFLNASPEERLRTLKFFLYEIFDAASATVACKTVCNEKSVMF